MSCWICIDDADVLSVARVMFKSLLANGVSEDIVRSIYLDPLAIVADDVYL